MKKRRNIFKIVAGTVAASITGIGNTVHAKPYIVQPILQDILQTQPMAGPVGLSFLLRYQEGKSSTDPLTLGMNKYAVEAQFIRDFNKFDRDQFRKILKKVATKQSHEYRSLISMANRVAVHSRRGCANIFVVHPEDKEYVESFFKKMDVNTLAYNLLTHPDVPKNYALAVYKGAEFWDGAGVLCPMKGSEKSRVGVHTSNLDKYMFLGRYK
jgi:hypothetical protein